MRFDYDGVDFTQLLQFAEDLREVFSDIQQRLDFLETRVICLEDQVSALSLHDSEY